MGERWGAFCEFSGDHTGQDIENAICLGKLMKLITILTHCGTSYGVMKLGQHLFRWLVAWSTPCHYLFHQCWLVVNWTPWKNKLLWNSYKNETFSVKKNTFENVICKMSSIFFKNKLLKTMMQTLLLLVAPEFVTMTTSGASSDDKVGFIADTIKSLL